MTVHPFHPPSCPDSKFDLRLEDPEFSGSTISNGTGKSNGRSLPDEGVSVPTSPNAWTATKFYLQGLSPVVSFAAVRRLAFMSLPSFIQSRPSTDQLKPTKLSRTSHLDGMRGLAAFFVFLCHLSYSSFVITKGYGFGEPGENRNILQLPIIRLVYSGPPMVAIFFVISGYALSLKPLRQIRSQQWESLSGTLTSSAFRRGLRLFVPTTCSTFLVFCMVRMGWFEGIREFANSPDYLRNVRERHAPLYDTLGLQFYDWFWSVFELVHVFGWNVFDGSTPYDLHLWTIPVEYRSSLALFMILLGVSRCKLRVRMTLMFGILWFSLLNNRWDVCLYLAGATLAELHLAQGLGQDPSAESDNTRPTLSSLTEKPGQDMQASDRSALLDRTKWCAVAMISLYLMSQPDIDFDKTPGWMFLSRQIPKFFIEKWRFYQCVGAVLLVWATNSSTTLRRPFNHLIPQYLGKISYALYLVHGPFIHLVGYRIERFMWSITGIETAGSYRLGFGLSFVFIIPLVIWTADLFWRAVDRPSVKFAHWVEQQCFT